MAAILEGIFKGLVQWVFALMLEIVEYIASSLLDVFNMDLSYFETAVPITRDIISVVVAAGWALLLGNLVFQAARSMASGLGFEGEDPVLLFTRTFVFSFLLLVSRQICDVGLGLTATVIEMLQVPSSVILPMPEETTFSIGASWLLVIIIGFIIMWQVVKLFFEIGERYVVTALLTILAPLAFAMGGSKSTADIFKGWVRMFGSMCLMMVFNVIFLKMLISAMAFMPSGVGVLPWMVLIMGIARVARKIDSIIARIGLNPAITGDGLGKSLPGMLAFSVARSLGSTVTKTIGKQGGRPSAAGGGTPGGPHGGAGGGGFGGGSSRGGGTGRGGAGRAGSAGAASSGSSTAHTSQTQSASTAQTASATTQQSQSTTTAGMPPTGPSGAAAFVQGAAAQAGTPGASHCSQPKSGQQSNTGQPTHPGQPPSPGADMAGTVRTGSEAPTSQQGNQGRNATTRRTSVIGAQMPGGQNTRTPHFSGMAGTQPGGSPQQPGPQWASDGSMPQRPPISRAPQGDQSTPTGTAGTPPKASETAKPSASRFTAVPPTGGKSSSASYSSGSSRTVHQSSVSTQQTSTTKAETTSTQPPHAPIGKAPPPPGNLGKAGHKGAEASHQGEKLLTKQGQTVVGAGVSPHPDSTSRRTQVAPGTGRDAPTPSPGQPQTGTTPSPGTGRNTHAPSPGQPPRSSAASPGTGRDVSPAMPPTAPHSAPARQESGMPHGADTARHTQRPSSGMAGSAPQSPAQARPAPISKPQTPPVVGQGTTRIPSKGATVGGKIASAPKSKKERRGKGGSHES